MGKTPAPSAFSAPFFSSRAPFPSYPSAHRTTRAHFYRTDEQHERAPHHGDGKRLGRRQTARGSRGPRLPALRCPSHRFWLARAARAHQRAVSWPAHARSMESAAWATQAGSAAGCTHRHCVQFRHNSTAGTPPCRRRRTRLRRSATASHCERAHGFRLLCHANQGLDWACEGQLGPRPVQLCINCGRVLLLAAPPNAFPQR